MVQIENFKQLLRNCLRQLWLEEMVHKSWGETKIIDFAANANSNRGQDKQVEFTRNDLGELSFEEKLQASLTKWAQTSSIGANSNIDQGLFHSDIYVILGHIALKPTIEAVITRFVTSDNQGAIIVFRKLEDFYRRWCDGEFIDAEPSYNLPQKQMLQLRSQKVTIGLRELDINTGLNVMILLLELHRIVRSQNHLQAEITFYPSDKPDPHNFFTSKLLRVIHYSDSIEIGNFSNVVGAFLKGAQLEGVYLGDANLTSVNFSNANLSGAYLGNANLTGVQASRANLSHAELGDANLSGADLQEANLIRSDLTHTNLSGADLSGADLSGADLADANLAGANLIGANLAGANLIGANLRDATLSGANFKNAILFGANLSDSNLRGVDISYADLCRADLSGANMKGSILKGTNLSDSILFNTNLKEAILVAANLSYAKLNGANLGGANLHKAIILGASLGDVDLSQVILKEADLSGADLSDAILLGSDLSYANLHHANLSGSNVSGAIFCGANLSHSNLSKAILSGIDLGEANLEEMTWNENLEWENIRGLDKALNVPQALKEKFRLA
jgi:uncharacterized protein YjbI with pentapeptide repeats